MQTVEVRFEGEKLATVTIEASVYTLYQVDDGSYFVHHDEGEAGAYLLTGFSAALATGHLREDMSARGLY